MKEKRRCRPPCEKKSMMRKGRSGGLAHGCLGLARHITKVTKIDQPTRLGLHRAAKKKKKKKWGERKDDGRIGEKAAIRFSNEEGPAPRDLVEW